MSKSIKIHTTNLEKCHKQPYRLKRFEIFKEVLIYGYKNIESTGNDGKSSLPLNTDAHPLLLLSQRWHFVCKAPDACSHLRLYRMKRQKRCSLAVTCLNATVDLNVLLGVLFDEKKKSQMNR